MIQGDGFVQALLKLGNPDSTSLGKDGHCPSNWFDCGDKCISDMWHCDGEDDCGNGADEKDCDTKSATITCPSRHFHCPGTDLCIPDKWRCDGHKDCSEGQDEVDCPAVSECKGFTCKNHECIPLRWRCDDIPDCLDESDEDCPAKSISRNMEVLHISTTSSGVSTITEADDTSLGSMIRMKELMVRVLNLEKQIRELTASMDSMKRVARQSRDADQPIVNSKYEKAP